MHFHILGLGPVGSLIAHNLRRTLPKAVPIALIVKDYQQAFSRSHTISVERDGVITTSTGYNMEVFDSKVHGRAPLAEYRLAKKTPGVSNEEGGQISSLIVTAKAFQTLPAIQQLQHRLTPYSTVVLLQNGMGIYEELLAKVFRNPELRPHFIFASNDNGAYAHDGRIVHSGRGSLKLGIAPDHMGRDFEHGEREKIPSRLARGIVEEGDPELPRYKSLRDTMMALTAMSELNCNWYTISHMQMAMRRKVVVNAAINTLTALMNCRNGDVFRQEVARELNARICEEAAAGFAAQIKAQTSEYINNLAREGYDPESLDPGRIPEELKAASLVKEVERVAKVTASNISSMLKHIHRGSPTEIDYINGYLLQIGAEFNVPMPTIKTLYDLVKLRSAIPLDQML